MANWCINNVLFTGGASKVGAVRELFIEIEDKQTETGQWHLPDFVTKENSFRRDI
jgi:hypothetical protein